MGILLVCVDSRHGISQEDKRARRGRGYGFYGLHSPTAPMPPMAAAVSHDKARAQAVRSEQPDSLLCAPLSRFPTSGFSALAFSNVRTPSVDLRCAHARILVSPLGLSPRRGRACCFCCGARPARERAPAKEGSGCTPDPLAARALRYGRTLTPRVLGHVQALFHMPTPTTLRSHSAR